MFHLYADEFQSFATESFALILSEARKYGLTLTLGHQYLGQLSDPLRQAVLGNTGSFIAFRVGAEDAELVAHHLGLGSVSAVQDLSNFQAYGRFLIGNAPSAPTRLDLYPPPEPSHPHPERLIANSRIRFGRDRREIEDRIVRFPPIANFAKTTVAASACRFNCRTLPRCEPLPRHPRHLVPPLRSRRRPLVPIGGR